MHRTVLVLLLCLGSTAAADEKQPKPKPLTTEQAADKVLEAVKAEDEGDLKALAEKNRPDPWLVADLLCYRGEINAAAAFGKAASRVDTEKLPDYIEAWRTREPDKAERELMAAMSAAMGARQPRKVVGGTASLPSSLDTAVRIRLRHARGIALRSVPRMADSATLLHEAGDEAQALGWLARAALLYYDAGVSAYFASALKRARASWEQALALAKRRGDEHSTVKLLGNLSIVHRRLGDYAKALATFEQVHARMLALGDKRGAAKTLANIATVHVSLGDLDKALAFYEKALAGQRALGDDRGTAATLSGIGHVHRVHGDLAKALAVYEQALATQKTLDDKRGAALTLGEIGVVYRLLGEFPKALAIQQKAYAQRKGLGDRGGAALSLGAIGDAQFRLGDYAKALTSYEHAVAELQALGDKRHAAAWLGAIGGIYQRVGDLAKALAIREQAHAQLVALGAKRGAAAALGMVAIAHASLGDNAKALSTLQEAHAQQKALGDKRGAAQTLRNIGNAHHGLGHHAQALSTYEQALVEAKAVGQKLGAANLLLNMGRVHRHLGDPAQARQLYEQSADAARDLGATRLLVVSQASLAWLHLSMGKSALALGAAQEALREVETLVGGFGHEQGAAVREQYAQLFALGTVSAVREEKVTEALAFLERGRAGALLDALDERELLRWKAESLSPELRRLDLEAQAGESKARHTYDLAVERGDRRKARSARKALAVAQDAVRTVAGRIQRESKQQASLFYPQAKAIGEIKEALAPDQALVLYGYLKIGKEFDEAVALVLRPDGERIVSLGAASELASACEALDATDPDADPTAALGTLRRLLVESLKLEAGVKQVLLSPEGPLCYVPFGALFDQAVAMTPSGTTHVVLVDEGRAKGEGILALGEPDYAGVSEGAQAIYVGGRTLSPLPATRKEVETVGTTTLLGAQASEAGFEATLATAKRWRAVHFACHGLVDIDRPMLSSLALSRAGEDDGFLTALEILHTRIPADLAVLSACETGKGKIVLGEGIVGLTRAFMFAGAPRVICSLWKVDDEATQALMIKFYELWNPKEGKGLGAAEALQQAQAFVRSQEKWKHPYYWAAWVLWGLPD